MAAEKTFENQIKQYLDDNDCWYVKFFANSFTKKGIPDILACVNGHFVGIEVKAQNGTPSELQKRNVKKINSFGGYAVVVRPDQFEDLQRLIQCIIYSAHEQARQICDKINTLWGI